MPENRAKPFDGDNSIRLAVVVLRAADTHSTQSPTFLLGGGPGQDVIGMYEGLLKSYQSLQKNGFPEEAYPGHLQDMQQFMAVMDLSMADLQKREFVYFD
ncbi:MAG TPA: hypothetical protein VHP14_24640, partial [Anaerolineales bacterium]|nr:hypothetical protein [Anaerolineales bacterium]